MNNEEVKKWITKAEEDLRVARNEIKTSRPPTSAICFHSQQSVEKYLKAYLVYHNKFFRKTHDIAEILELCIEIEAEFKELEKINVHELTVYATELRYPEFFHIPSVEEAKETIEIAIKVRDFVFKKLKIREGDLLENEKRGS